MQKTDAVLQGLQQLLLVPEGFEFMIGYFEGPDVRVSPDAPRFVAFYWDAELGDVRYDDGNGDWECNHEFWAEYLTSEDVSPEIEGLVLGLDDGPAGHFLLLDRTTRWLYAGHISRLSLLMHGNGTSEFPGLNRW